MTMHHWTKALGVLGLGLATMTGTASAQQHQQADLPGPIDSLTDLQDTGRMVFKLVDENNDGQISQKEAVDAGNLAVGGLFFRADANGDGTVTKAEADQARDSLLTQKPMVRFLIERDQDGPAGRQQPRPWDQSGRRCSWAWSIPTMMATSRPPRSGPGGPDGRDQGLFAAADTNRDGLMSPVEVNAAIAGAVKAAQKASFAAADGNGRRPDQPGRVQQGPDRPGQRHLQDPRRQQRRPALAPGASAGRPDHRERRSSGPSCRRLRQLGRGTCLNSGQKPVRRGPGPEHPESRPVSR